MKKFVFAALIMAIFMMLLAGCGKNAPSQTSQAQKKQTITIVDEENRAVEVPCPPERIACLSPSVAEVICALGEAGKIVARGDDAAFPPVLQEKPSVGTTQAVNIERLLAQKPDVVVLRAGTLTKPEIMEKIEAAGIPVVKFWSIELDTVLPMIEQMGKMLNKEAKAAELAGFIQKYQETVEKRLANLKTEEKPQVFFQTMGHMHMTNSGDTAGHRRIVAAGGRNIAADEKVRTPQVSAEWVLERNPDVIVHSYMKASKTINPPSPEELKKLREEIMSEPGLKKTKAVKNNRVYVIDTRLITGPRSVVGLLYFAKWFHPELFKDIDPAAVHREMLKRFYNLEVDGSWVYP